MLHGVALFAAGFASAFLLRFMLSLPPAVREARAMRRVLLEAQAEADARRRAVTPIRDAKPR